MIVKCCMSYSRKCSKRVGDSGHSVMVCSPLIRCHIRDVTVNSWNTHLNVTSPRFDRVPNSPSPALGHSTWGLQLVLASSCATNFVRRLRTDLNLTRGSLGLSRVNQLMRYMATKSWKKMVWWTPSTSSMHSRWITMGG